jgi:group I intron endonuclease
MDNLFTDTFPVLVAFENLGLIENIQNAKNALKGQTGIYAFVHIPTGTSYIGSSIDLGVRIMDHILNHSSNPHLQNAFLKYGLSHYAFVILEYCLSSDQLKREQHFLDLLFTLPLEFRYNLARIAEAPFTGLTHTQESVAKMSDSQQLVDRSGDKNPMYGRTGANHPMYGKYGITPTNAMTVNVYSAVDNQLVRSFSSQIAVAKWLGINKSIVSRHIKSGKV